jgi:hypothetical protein
MYVRKYCIIKGKRQKLTNFAPNICLKVNRFEEKKSKKIKEKMLVFERVIKKFVFCVFFVDFLLISGFIMDRRKKHTTQYIVSKERENTQNVGSCSK